MEKELLSLDVQKFISKSAELQYVSPDDYRNKNKIRNIIFHLFLKVLRIVHAGPLALYCKVRQSI